MGVWRLWENGVVGSSVNEAKSSSNDTHGVSFRSGERTIQGGAAQLGQSTMEHARPEGLCLGSHRIAVRGGFMPRSSPE